MVNIEEIYKNISEYDITKENVIKSLFKGSKEDTSHFYYRSMILQLLKNSGHLDEIITLYYKNERGFNYGKWVNINIDGKVVKKSKSDLFKEAKQRIHILYSQFEMGRYEELEKILDWATKISSSFSVACHNNDKFGYIKDWFDETLMNLIIEFDNIELDIHSKMGIIRRNEEQKKKEEEEISKQRTLTVTRKNKTHVRTIKHRFFLKFFHFLQNQQRNKELEAEYKKIMMEEDIEKFIRGCARLHFNFLRIHPFLDGNGRTARILLSTMLASRNIFFPSVYIDREGKEDFYIASNAALTGRYERTEQDLLSRIGHFYPMVLPKNKGENMER